MKYKFNYTPAQEAVIDSRSCNLLVSAAAGSGKTAVLTQRIINRVTNPDEGISIDRILIVTFTKAAAAEMRERIGAALHDELQKNPKDVHIKKQITLLNSAQITTIDSFCLYLLRNHFHDIGLDPAFRIADENEIKLMKEDVLEDIFNRRMANPDEAFETFMEQYTNGWNIQPAKDRILQIYEFTGSHPFPDDWIDECYKNVLSCSSESFDKEGWMEFLCDYEKEVYNECLMLSKEALEICNLPDGPTQYVPAITSDMEFYLSLNEANSFQDRSAIFSAHSYERLSAKKNPDQSEEKKETVKKLRENAKALISDWHKSMYYLDAETIRSDYLAGAKSLLYMLDLVKEFSQELKKRKQEKNLIDFSDMEHKALEVLLRKENNLYVPTEVAKAYASFFEEIMVDEYQDSNAVQELLLESISRQSESFGNRFMVGDVKQSIYRFRLAKPEIFMEKYNLYQKEGSVNKKIDLSENFRSRKEVVNSVNAVFEKLMLKSVGGVAYDKDARLNASAVYPENKEQSNRSKLLFFDRKKMKECVEAGIIPKCSNTELEARMIASEIKKLRADFYVTDKETKELRPAKYSDMVILLRVANGVDEVYKKVFMQENIPAHITSRTGYFQTPEVHLLLDYLSLLDNPRQDIALMAVLHSHIGGFSEEEIARVRIARSKQELLYDSLLEYTQIFLQQKDSGRDYDIAFRLNAFLQNVESMRHKAVYMDVYHLLEEVIKSLDYENYVSLLPGGEQRRANVRLLLQKAKGFEDTGYSGLFHFVRYIESMKENAMDFGEANILSEDAEVVRIMTIHKSKGLEFPICFVSGLSKQFRRTDYSDAVLCDEKMGVGCNYFDRKSRQIRTTLCKNAIGIKKRLDARGEDIRILYVALTRAKEKLIMTGYVNDIEKEEPCLNFSQSSLLRATSFMGMCMPLILGMPEYFELEEMTPEALLEQDVNEVSTRVTQRKALNLYKPEKLFKEYVYPHSSLEGLYVKTTVSELKKAAYLEKNEETQDIYISETETEYVPDFISKKEEAGGTRRGSAYHRVMELLDYTDIPEADLFTWYSEQTDKMVTSLKISKEETELVNARKVLGFLANPLAGRMGRAQQNGVLYKEQPFVLGIEANQLKKEFPSEEIVLIQGVIDVYFEEDGELVILDYKTDRVDNVQELVARYATQLDYYAMALERTEHKKVKEKIIYSFALQEVIVL